MEGRMLKENDRMFFIDKEIIILKIFEIFQLAKVRYLDSIHTFMVDLKALSDKADITNSISIKWLGGVT